jgi:hypothetical protein
VNVTLLDRPHGQINTANIFDLFARDARAFRAAGIRPVAALASYGIRAASDALDWPPRDLLRIPGVGRATVEKLVALVAMQ